MRRAAIAAIGVGQLVNWGVLYFAFGVLLVPLARDLDASRSLVAGAFSLGLLVSAVTAPLVGRLADRGFGPLLIQLGGVLAAMLLVAWPAIPTLLGTYVIWSLLGISMSAILYEPVFVIIGRAIADPRGRMRAIATVTVMGGLASSAFLPGTAALVATLGWRGSAVALGVIIGSTTLIVGRVAFRDQGSGIGDQGSAIGEQGSGSGAQVNLVAEFRRAILGRGAGDGAAQLPGLNRMVFVFGISSVVNSAIASNLVAALIDGGFAPGRAATVAGLFGIMQLPGRSLLTRPSFAPNPVRLVLVSFALQVAGLVALMFHVTPLLVSGVIVFAAGAGLTTLARPFWVLQRYGAEPAGYANGVIARAQQIARAFGPVSAAALAERTSYAAVFMGLSLLLLVAAQATFSRRRQH